MAIATVPAKTIELTTNWEEPESSTDYENQTVEVEMLLSDASNVTGLHWVFDSFGDAPYGVALELSDGTRTFLLTGQGETLNFDADGNLILGN